MKNVLPMRVKFAKLSENAVIPVYAHKGDSGMDLVTPISITLEPGVPTFVDTQIAIEIPHGFEGQVRSRSGMTKLGVTAGGGLGTIDSTYRGSIGVTLTWALSVQDLINSMMFNNIESFASELMHLKKTISAGSKIAQLVIAPVVEVEQIVVDYSEFSSTKRGTGGFGSTGT